MVYVINLLVEARDIDTAPVLALVSSNMSLASLLFTQCNRASGTLTKLTKDISGNAKS